MKKLTLLLVIALLLVSASSVWANNYSWDGKNGLDSQKCGLAGQAGRPESGWIHWVFTGKGSSTDATLTLGGTGSGSYSPGHPTNANVWHFYTPYFDVKGLTASVVLSGGSAAKNARLVISDYCPGGTEKLSVKKTAVTHYTRTHFWSIKKSVDPMAFWLYVNGSGDGKATWTVDLKYEGKQDSDHKISGQIIIKNTGSLTAVVTNVFDELAGAAIPVNCPGGLPYSLGIGAELICSYSQDGYVTGTNEVTVTTEKATYGASAEINWGGPSKEINKDVTVTDESDLFGNETLGTSSAPEGTQFEYDKEFKWADYGREKCGDYTYNNTARVIGDNNVILAYDTAKVDVHVQCMIFRGETAWAANGDVPLQLRYTDQGNWATYVEYAAKTTTLFAGQTKNVGMVTFSAVSGGKVTITVNLTGGWEFEDVAENLKIQDYASAPSGNPSPGGFDHKKTCDVSGTTCSIEVPANNFYGVHVNVGWWIPDPKFP
jgi:hypothetical protein